jgi:putative SOS response-associated peptidase YedK
MASGRCAAAELLVALARWFAAPLPADVRAPKLEAMCGRYDFEGVYDHGDDLSFARFFQVDVGLALPRPRWNVAPTQQVAAIRLDPGDPRRKLVQLRWGLIPSWAKDASIGARTINARSETVATKPAFRDALRRRRCLIPATGFYEWEKLGKLRQPWRIVLRSREPFAMAGLWERWRPPEGPSVETCTILTTEANELVRPLHDRMPVILARAAWEPWLDVERFGPAEVLPLLRPYPSEELERYAVGREVNDVRNDHRRLIEPLPPPAPPAAV